MKILCTGYNGFIGSHLMDRFKEERAHTVTGISRHNGFSLFDPRLSGMIERSDVVVHLAGVSSVSESIKESEHTYLVNVIGTAQVLKWCIKYKKKLIFASSWAVYDKDSSPYAHSKFLAEELVSKFYNTTVLRFFNVYGQRVNQRSGSLFYWFLKGIQDGKIKVDGTGTQTRDFIHVKDLANILHDAIVEDWRGAVLDCGTGNLTSVAEIAELFKKNSGVAVEYGDPKPGAAGRAADIKALRHYYKGPEMVKIETGIESLINDP